MAKLSDQDLMLKGVRNVDFMQAGKIGNMIAAISKYSIKIKFLTDCLG